MDFEKLSYAVRGAAMEVYNELGPGLLESVYEKALMRELELRGIKSTTQVPVEIVYKGEKISSALRADIVVEDTLILEIKSVEDIKDVHYKQLRTYLKLMNKPLGWVLNFGEYDFAEGMRRVTNKFYKPFDGI